MKILKPRLLDWRNGGFIDPARHCRKELAKKTTAAAYEASQPGNVLTKVFRPDVEKAFAIKCSQFENQVSVCARIP